MKLQSTAPTILLATAFAGICGILLMLRLFPKHDWVAVWIGIIITSPMWVPCLFAAYMMSQRDLTRRLVVTFAVVESLAVIITILAITGWLVEFP